MKRKKSTIRPSLAIVVLTDGTRLSRELTPSANAWLVRELIAFGREVSACRDRIKFLVLITDGPHVHVYNAREAPEILGFDG